MVATNGTVSNIQILLVDEQAASTTSLHTELSRLGFDVRINQDLHTGEASVFLPDVQFVVAYATPYNIAQLHHLRHRGISAVVVLLSDEAIGTLTDAEIDGVADVVLPPDAKTLATQLRYITHLKTENNLLRKKIDELESSKSSHQRLANEMEILKNAIVRNVSHELRTPLLQVKSAVSMMAEDLENQKLTEYAQNAMARLEILVKNITMLGASLDTNPGPIILRDAIEYAQRNLNRIWIKRSTADRIILQVEEKLPPVLADKQGLSTVLQLLLDNALKFSDDQIEIIGKMQGDSVYVGVRDKGIGIADEDRRTIFDSFYQVDNDSTRRYGGTGIGLTLVKLILDNHQVDIQVESQVGSGSCFWFLLPAVHLDDQPPMSE